MRVIAGCAKSLPLKTLDSMETRPTQDKIKETLFNILQPDLPGCLFLDLFAGSGSIGIEALSRGARKAWFAERNRKAVEIIRSNLSFTHLEQKAELISADVLTALSLLEGQKEPFDFIFMDPPYRQGEERRVLEYLSAQAGHVSFLDPYTIIIVEASLDTGFDYLVQSDFEIFRQKKYKTNQHVFIRLKENKK